MRRTLFGFALLGLLSGMVAPANAAAPMYKVTPLTAPVDGQIIVHDLSWRCSSGSCFAPRTGSSTDTTVCLALARNFGPLAAFAAGDSDFDAAAIEKCNRRAH